MEALKRLRKERGLTQERLAERAGLDRVTIALAENGKRTPQLPTAEALARALDVPLAALLGEPPKAGSLELPPSIAEYARLFHLQPEPDFDLQISEPVIHRKFEAAYIGVLEAERTGGYRLFVEASDALAALAEQLDRLTGPERATVLDRVIRLFERALAGQRAGIEAAERRAAELRLEAS